MNRSRPLASPGVAFLFASLIGTALSGGCSGSKMTNMWKDPSYDDGAMKKVFAIAVRRDPVRRRVWEDAFVQELKAHGVSADPSYGIFPLETPDSSQVSEVVRKEGYDGVAISVRLSDVTKETHVAGYTKREPVLEPGPFLRGYTTYWRDVRVPGYTETNQMRRYQTNVWTTRNGGRLIWSGTVETADAAASGPLGKVIRNRIVAELVTAGILPPRTK